MEQEEWRKIDGYDNYSISNFGRVRNDKTKKIRKTYINKEGYSALNLSNNNGVLKKISIHRLVGLAFIPNLENLQQIHHIDNNPSNNNVSNLRWVTNIENTQSKNRTCNVGFISSYIKNDTEYYVAGFRNYGIRHQKYSKDKEICEEWLKNRRYEIENELEITKDKIY
jgi:hypothetical protein